MCSRESLLKSASVLVIEDNEFTMRLIATILRKIGVGTVYEAASVWNAFNILNISPVSLILCDLEMEPMGGLAFIKLLRSSRLPEGMTPNAPLDTGTPVAVLTAHTAPEIVKRARDVGATAFLTKPINPTLLQRRLEALLRERASNLIQGNGLLRVVFRSEVAPGVTKEHIKSILSASQAKNPARNIGSMLCFDTTHFLEILEGPHRVVDALYSKIMADTRHRNVQTVIKDGIKERLLENWAMLYMGREPSMVDLYRRRCGCDHFAPDRMDPPQIMGFLTEVIARHQKS
jgi:two-component system, chemotaxis family, chemotaxis protein CheY